MRADVWLSVVLVVLCGVVVCVIGPGADPVDLQPVQGHGDHNRRHGPPGLTAAGPVNLRRGQPSSVGINSKDGKNQTSNPTPKSATTESNCTGNSSVCENNSQGLGRHLKEMISKNRGMLMRTLYVLIGVTAVIIVYFVLRTWRTRRKSKTKKYGVLTTPASDMEMTPLDQEDDDEDMTVFEVNGLHK